MNKNTELLLQCLEADLIDLKEMLKNNGDRGIILSIIKEYMIPQLQEIAEEI